MYLNLIHEDLVSSVRLLMNKVQLFCGIHLFFIKAAVSANLSCHAAGFLTILGGNTGMAPQSADTLEYR